VGAGTIPQSAGPELTIGLIAALPAEIRSLTPLPIALNTPFRINNHLVAIVCGIGAKNAAKAAQYLLYQDVQGLISWGTAGALSAELKSGDLVLPDIIQAADGKRYQADNIWLEQLQTALNIASIKIHTGLLVESNSILDSGMEKSALSTKIAGAITTDMETAAIMKIAQENKIPAIAIRSIVDQVDDQIPVEILRHTDQFGTPRILNILREIIRKPQLLTHLIRLSGGMRAATRTLRSVAAGTNETLMYLN
jgi:adenosylhomocysteine nucleosidase